MGLLEKFRQKNPMLNLNGIYQVFDSEYFIAMIHDTYELNPTPTETIDFQVKRLKISDEDLSNQNFSPLPKRDVLLIDKGVLLEYLGNDANHRLQFRFASCKAYENLVITMAAGSNESPRRLGLEKYKDPFEKILNLPRRDSPAP